MTGWNTKKMVVALQVDVTMEVFTCCACGQEAPDPAPPTTLGEMCKLRATGQISPNLSGWCFVEPHREDETSAPRAFAVLCPACVPPAVRRALEAQAGPAH